MATAREYFEGIQKLVEMMQGSSNEALDLVIDKLEDAGDILTDVVETLEAVGMDPNPTPEQVREARARYEALLRPAECALPEDMRDASQESTARYLKMGQVIELPDDYIDPLLG